MKLYIFFQINFQLISLLLQLSAPQAVYRRQEGGQRHLFSFFFWKGKGEGNLFLGKIKNSSGISPSFSSFFPAVEIWCLSFVCFFFFLFSPLWSFLSGSLIPETSTVCCGLTQLRCLQCTTPRISHFPGRLVRGDWQ